MNWRELEQAAPEIAELGRERLSETGVALLATLREDGSPRISPIEPYLSHGHLLFGSMSWSAKTRDLLRDRRCAIHSTITGPDKGDGELKLYGAVILANDLLRNDCPDGWWIQQPPDAAVVFDVNIDRAAFVSWDLEHGEMTVRHWSPQHGVHRKRRRYP